MRLDFNGNFKGKNHIILYGNKICYTMTPPSGRSCVTPASPVFFFFIRAISNNFDIILTSGQKKKSIYCVLQFGTVWCNLMCFMRLHIHEDSHKLQHLYPILEIPSDLFYQTLLCLHFLLCQGAHHTLRARLMKSIMNRFLVNI